MRYNETGEVHKDFHRSLNGTIAWLRQTHGDEFLDETFRRTALDVYAAIHADLKAGNAEHLVAHWDYFFTRDGGDYSIQRDGETITLTVHRCPAVAYLHECGMEVDPAFCRQTVVMNEALSQDTPFEIHTQVLGDARCVQTIRRRSGETTDDSQ